jgi:hypothetical protein
MQVKLIVLDRLSELKKHHSKVVQEMLMDILRALSSPNIDICKKVRGDRRTSGCTLVCRTMCTGHTSQHSPPHCGSVTTIITTILL